MLDCFAVCAPGLEAVLAVELTARGVRGARPAHGGVAFRSTTRQLYDTNAWLRTASRVLVRAATFRATSFPALERHAADVPWHRWITPGTAVRVRASSSGSRLYHTEAIASRLRAIMGAAPDLLQAPEHTAPAEQLVVARVHRDVVTLSVDASGEHLHKRGWRLATAKAPLRETLAAAMVLASGWPGDAPLLDPFCGSGTIAIEAARIGAGLPPSPGRTYAFQRWPSFEPGTWASVEAGLRRSTERPPSLAAPIVAADRDAGAVRVAEENAARAGVAELVEVRRGSFTETLAGMAGRDDRRAGMAGRDDRRAGMAGRDDRRAGWIVTNPPYGRRVRGGDLRDLFASIGRSVRDELPGWHVGMLIADRTAAGHARLTFEDRFVTSNGGIPVTFAVAVTG